MHRHIIGYASFLAKVCIFHAQGHPALTDQHTRTRLQRYQLMD